VNIVKAGYYPCKVYVSLGGANHVVVPVSKSSTATHPLRVEAAGSRIRDVMGPALEHTSDFNIKGPLPQACFVLFFICMK
jgi:hypothetical protein